MIKKQVARSRFTKWDRVIFSIFGALLVVVLLVTLLLMMTIVDSIDGLGLAGARCLEIGTTAGSANTGVEAAQPPQPDSDPVKLCSVNWED